MQLIDTQRRHGYRENTVRWKGVHLHRKRKPHANNLPSIPQLQIPRSRYLPAAHRRAADLCPCGHRRRDFSLRQRSQVDQYGFVCLSLDEK